MIEEGTLKVGDVVQVTDSEEKEHYANGTLVTVSRVSGPDLFAFDKGFGEEQLVWNREVSWPTAGASGDYSPEAVKHPQHYGGDTTYEAIKVIEAWDLGFHTGNTVKYISRAGKKDKDKELEDINKAIWYLERHRDNLEAEVG